MERIVILLFLFSIIVSAATSIRETKVTKYENSGEHFNMSLPLSKNWIQNGAVTSVKDQRYLNQRNPCRAGWAFAAVSVVESHHFIKTGNLIDLSVQNLIDCSSGFYLNQWCQAGRVPYALEYIVEEGINTDHQYPYVEEVTYCSHNKSDFTVKIKGYTTLKDCSVQFIKRTIANKGPVAVDVFLDHIIRYSGGILSMWTPTNEKPDHSMVIVGYDIKNGIEYWIIKNSLGTHWGENGYILVDTRSTRNLKLDTIHYPEL